VSERVRERVSVCVKIFSVTVKKQRLTVRKKARNICDSGNGKRREREREREKT
jgi:hypothetical protein